MVISKDKKIAIDIVLLLPPEVVEKYIFVNSQLDNSNYVSFTNGYNPHITLGMGCVSVDSLENLKNKIGNISQKTKPFERSISGFVADNSSIEILKNQEIKNLHFSIMKVLEEIASYGNA